MQTALHTYTSKIMRCWFTYYNFIAVLLVDMVAETSNPGDVDGVTASGDIIIGGLFPIHRSVDITYAEDGIETRTCNRFSYVHLVQSLVMVQEIEEINRSGKLGNLTLGYCILDSCSDVATALQRTLSFMKTSMGEPDDGLCARTGFPSVPILGVLGDLYSETCVAIARQLNLEHIPEISYGATSGLLSDKTRFPNFLRTMPEDYYQVRAIIKILKKHDWNWIGIVVPDSNYGRYALRRLRDLAVENQICLAFVSILPNDLNARGLSLSLKRTVKMILDNERAKVIVSFARRSHMKGLFRHLLPNPRGRRRVWVASDSWAHSFEVLQDWPLDYVGVVIGISPRHANASKFERYLENIDLDPRKHPNNTFLQRFLLKHSKQSPEQNVGAEAEEEGSGLEQVELVELDETPVEILKRKINPYILFSMGLAVRAFAQALVDVCDYTDCKRDLKPYQFLRLLHQTKVRMEGKIYKFDSFGNVNTEYYVGLWKQNSDKTVERNVMAHYCINTNALTFTSLRAMQEFLSLTSTFKSKCTANCSPGFMKQSVTGQQVCCYQCEECPENYYSNVTDSDRCNACNTDTHYASKGSTSCSPKKLVFLSWDDMSCIIPLVFTAVGALLSIMVAVLFIVSWNTPVVRASVGPISLLLLLSLLGTFVSVIFFCGWPNRWRCRTQQILFGLSYTLCMSSILVKSYKIILAFEFNPSVKRILNKLYKPYIIIATCMTPQIIICTVWLTLHPPQPKWDVNFSQEERLLMCDVTSRAMFVSMLGYIGFLALVGFVLAFKGRNLPQSYNEAKFITFGMLIYIICWIVFGPVYANVKGKYPAAVEMVVILFTSYGILACHFLPKCFIILCKKKANTVDAFKKDVRIFSLRDFNDEDRRDQHSSSPVSLAFQNPAFRAHSSHSQRLQGRSSSMPSL